MEQSSPSDDYLKEIHDHLRLLTLGTMMEEVIREVSNLLTPALDCCELLEREALSPEATRSFTTVRSALIRSTGSLRRLLQLAQAQRPAWGEVDLLQLVRSAMHLAECGSTGGGTTTHLSCPANLPPVSGDRVLLEQVFHNLFLRTCYNTPGDGRVEVSVEHRGNDVVVRVCHTGQGGTVAANDGAAGPSLHTFSEHPAAVLTLPTCCGIVNAHGGRLDFQSSPDQGTSFVVLLPVGAAEVTRDPPGAMAVAPARNPG